MQIDLNKILISNLAEELLKMNFAEAESTLDLFSEENREIIVCEIFKKLHAEKAKKIKTAKDRRKCEMFAPKIMLCCGGKKRKVDVTYKGQTHRFDDIERAFAFCECVRQLEMTLDAFGFRGELSPVVTYGVPRMNAVDSLYPRFLKEKKVFICIEK